MEDFEAARMARRILANTRHGIEIFETSIETVDALMSVAENNFQEGLRDLADQVALSTHTDTPTAVRMMAKKWKWPALWDSYIELQKGMVEERVRADQVIQAEAEFRAAHTTATAIDQARSTLDRFGLAGIPTPQVMAMIEGRGGWGWAFGLITGPSRRLELAIQEYPRGLRALSEDVQRAAKPRPDLEALKAAAGEASRLCRMTPKADRSDWHSELQAVFEDTHAGRVGNFEAGFLAATAGVADSVMAKIYHGDRLAELQGMAEEQIFALKSMARQMEAALKQPQIPASMLDDLPVLLEASERYAKMGPYQREQLTPMRLHSAFEVIDDPARSTSQGVVNPCVSDPETAAPVNR